MKKLHTFSKVNIFILTLEGIIVFDFKRIADLVMATSAIILLLPVILVVALVVRIKLGTPILFRQQRPGQHGKPFMMYKFRTMTDKRDEQNNLLPDSVRLTRFGKFLRSTSLDELPELYNVLVGEMSIVGPRPLLMHYLDYYTSEQMRRHDLRPGITGWAQVNGRNTISWEEKFTYDVWYVDHQSFLLDLKIILLTLLKLFKREGISQPGHVTSNEFIGSKS